MEVISSTEVDEWFTVKVLPLEAGLTRYLYHHWRDRSEVSDLRQEVYTRVYEAATKAIPPSPRSFVFTIARNLIIDRIRRARIVPIEVVANIDSLNQAAEDPSPEQQASSREAMRLIQEALTRLSPRRREAFVYRKILGLSQRETALRMNITEYTLERHLSEGLRSLAADLLNFDVHTNTLRRAGRKGRAGP